MFRIPCVSAIVLAAIIATMPGTHAAQTVSIRLKGSDSGETFQGVGAVSAGASTRLLYDYAEPYRSDVLDFLFKPGFGAGLPAPEGRDRRRGELDLRKRAVACRHSRRVGAPQSPGIRILADAGGPQPQSPRDARLPALVLPGLDPGAVLAGRHRLVRGLPRSRPQAVRDGSRLGRRRRRTRTAPTATGSSRASARPWNARASRSVKIQAPDCDKQYWAIFDEFGKDPAYRDAVDAVGYHYVNGREPWHIDQVSHRDTTPKAKASGKQLWASEEWSMSGGKWDGTGAMFLARLINKLYIRDRICKTEIWCPIASIYEGLPWSDTGAMQADSPWSGHYAVWPAIWAVAHTTQFAQPGWKYLDGGCGQIDPRTWKGTYVSLKDPRTGDWSMIVCTDGPTTLRSHGVRRPEDRTGPRLAVRRSGAVRQARRRPLVPGRPCRPASTATRSTR